MKNIKIYLFFIILIELGGLLVGLLTNNSMDMMLTSSLTPPPIVFPIVWTILYALMGISLTRIYLSNSKNKELGITIFIIQLLFNYLWSFFFFNLKAYTFSFIWLIILWVLIVLMIITFFKIDKKSSLIQIPYLLWVTFALYLNYIVSILNV